MFQMIDEEKPTADDRKVFWTKVGLFVVAIAAAAGLIYFFAMGTSG